MSDEPPQNLFDVIVSGHFIVEEGDSYDNHVFIIDVFVDGLNYSVDRSYVDFVDLDRRIQRKYPRCQLPNLPLSAASTVERALGKIANAKSTDPERKRSISVIMNPASPEKDASKFLQVRKDDKEPIQAKVVELDLYLKKLLSLHEVLASDEILLFLDEEAPSMSVEPESLEPITVHDLLLVNERVNKTVVRRSEEVRLRVPLGHLIVWRFQTEKYDIGFSLEIDSEPKVSYTRYNSHEKPAMGTVEATQNCSCVLKWDNSYARRKCIPCLRLINA